ncbi:hypothetical protein J4459_00535 [Candidatus Woesearchaeota archaeon]|nr:hypothetical protein [Candidatus Woesearchaeota archaeon]
MEGDIYFQKLLEGSRSKLESPIRNETFLKERLEKIWSIYFNDVKKLNEITIRFKGKWKNKFGHIHIKENKTTEIVINGFLRDSRVPEYIIDLTIAHELVHYSHGFQSPHPKLYKHPHAGGIVTKDLKKRGFIEQLKQERKWIKEIWQPIIKEEFQKSKRSRRFWF